MSRPGKGLGLNGIPAADGIWVKDSVTASWDDLGRPDPVYATRGEDRRKAGEALAGILQFR